MIAKQLKRRNAAAACYVIGMAAAIALNTVGRSDLTERLMWPILVAMIAACWFYLKAKKRSGGCLLLLPLNVVAFTIYWWMEDCSEVRDNIACPACGTANYPEESACRFCKTTMAAPANTI